MRCISFIFYSIRRALARKGWAQFVPVIAIVAIIYFACFVWFQTVGDADLSETCTTRPSAEWAYFSRFFAPANQTIGIVKCPPLGYVIPLLGLLFIAVLTSTFFNLFEGIGNKYSEGDGRYRMSGHNVIIGNDIVAISVLRSLYEEEIKKNRKPGTWSIVYSEQEASVIRADLERYLPKRVLKRIVVLRGSTIMAKSLKRLYVDAAAKVFIIGDRNDENRDTANLHTLEVLSGIVKDRAHKPLIPCHLMFNYQSSFGVYQAASINKAIENKFDFVPFNNYELWAQRVMVCRNMDASKSYYLPLEGTNILGTDSDKHVHLVIVGMNRMGVALAVEAAHLAHYPNFVSKGVKTRITFIAKDADTEHKFINARLSQLFDLCRWQYKEAAECKYGPIECDESRFRKDLGGDFLDIEWEYINGGIEDDRVRRYLTDAANDGNNILNIACCMNMESQSFAAAAYLPSVVRERASQILVYTKSGNSLVNNVNAKVHVNGSDVTLEGSSLYARFKAFGMESETFDKRNVDLFAAKMIGYKYSLQYEIIEQRKKIKNGEMDEKDTVDYSFLPETADCLKAAEKEWMQAGKSKTRAASHWSNIYNAHSFWCKMRNIGLNHDAPISLDERQIDVLAKVEHNRWNMEQLLLGFRPTSVEETKEILSASGRGKDDFKKKLMAHLDLRCMDELKKVDQEVVEYDYALTEALPLIYEADRRI